VNRVHDQSRKGPSPIGHAIKAFLRDTGLGARPRDMRVFQAWKDAVGDELAQRVVPVRYRDGELTVEVESTVHLQELKSFTGEGYRREANARLGNEAIRKLAFKLRS